MTLTRPFNIRIYNGPELLNAHTIQLASQVFLHTVILSTFGTTSIHEMRAKIRKWLSTNKEVSRFSSCSREVTFDLLINTKGKGVISCKNQGCRSMYVDIAQLYNKVLWPALRSLHIITQNVALLSSFGVSYPVDI